MLDGGRTESAASGPSEARYGKPPTHGQQTGILSGDIEPEPNAEPVEAKHVSIERAF